VEIPEFEDLELGGMGLAFIRQTATQMRYRREGEYNILELCFELPTYAPPLLREAEAGAAP
jgi:anti-sigma regulatory factor (Ser/Thr protein kinase)